ncbi:unnamed protein product [Schistosoma mattheei]|uniref:Uncharacterized protein n=1 Tax=Schistosoma mattheei TaxID=31246 RepID=A0A3P7Y8W2_9TREM|nr:unnamed protein product [Schistosoma mattheei]
MNWSLVSEWPVRTPIEPELEPAAIVSVGLQLPSIFALRQISFRLNDGFFCKQSCRCMVVSC